MTKPIHDIALFRLSVLGPLASRAKLLPGELKLRLTEISQQQYAIPGSKRNYISAKTIERWFYAYKRGGIDALTPVTRIDKGKSKLPLKMQKQIIALKKDNPARSVNTIIKMMKINDVSAYLHLSRASVHRLLKQHNLSKQVISSDNQIEHRAFETKFANDIWYSDVMHGPMVVTPQGMRKALLISVFDDASRLVCHSQFCLAETTIEVEAVLKQALLKRGLPLKFVVDNGACYRAKSLKTICARLQIHLVYCRPYQPEGKGKLERWHSTVRSQFLNELLPDRDYSLDDLNARLWPWIEQCYHQTKHSAIKDGLTPQQRWLQNQVKVQPLGHYAPKLDEYFYHRIKRFVRKTGTISWNGMEFEVEYKYAGAYVLLVVEPHAAEGKWIESLNYDYLGPVHPLNKISNSSRQRQRPETIVTKQRQHSLVESIYDSTNFKYNLTED